MPLRALSREYPDLTELPLEALMDIEVTSVSKRPQKASRAAAAVFVITQDDIRRSGVTSIPEALRMVPGLQVARVDSNKWAISSRGFNGIYANKLLVLMDGRSLYTPQFSGVFWHLQDTFLEDIDRIEVIRGPGAALWGANAVNGVINIITKPAIDTQGGLVTAGAGTEERVFGGFRFGGSPNEDTHYRVYGKYFMRDDSVLTTGREATDDWDTLRGGFHIDRQDCWNGALTLQGDIYKGNAGAMRPAQTVILNQEEYNGANLLGRWDRVFSDESLMSLQMYYDRTQYEASVLDETRDTLDMDFQHRFSWGTQHRVIWGLGYRWTHDNTDGKSAYFVPAGRNDDLVSAFLQDELSFLENRVHLTFGSKFEHNDYSGFEIQPNIRLLWEPNKKHLFWSAISRAVRTPSRSDHDAVYRIVIPPPFNTRIYLRPTDDTESEKLTAYELGYRIRPLERISLDIAAFYNDYHDLRTFELRGTAPDFHVEFGNKMKGYTYGAELALDWRIWDTWRLTGAYTFLEMRLNPDKDSTDIAAEIPEGESPRHQFSIRSSMDLSNDLELDVWARYVDNLPSHSVSSYIGLDARIAWKVSKNMTFSIVGQNLLDRRHREFGSDFNTDVPPTEVERSVYGKITWRF